MIEKNRLMSILLVFWGIFMIGLIAIIYTYLSPNFGENQEVEEYTNNAVEVAKKDQEIKKIDFQPIVDDWVNSVNGNKSVIIYDLDRNEVAGSYNTNEEYYTASLYKLFVVYEGYRRIDSGVWNPDDKVGLTGYSILECLDKSIRESYSPCAETLWDMIGVKELGKIIENDYEIRNSDVPNLLSNSEDILKIMQLFYKHSDIKNEKYLTILKDSFLNQPTTDYNWRQGLPSGFSDRVKIYNKVGWDYNVDTGGWNVYHDAAIVEFPDENRHFAVIVMTNYIPFKNIAELGKKIENAFYHQ